MRRAPSIAFTALLVACSVFNESMRKPKGAADGGAADGGAAAGTCELSLPPGKPAGACGGAGGGDYTGGPEVEPNDTTPERLLLATVVCGTIGPGDTDRFVITLAAGCYELAFVAQTASFTMTGPGVNEAHAGAATVPLSIDAGDLTVVVTGASSEAYRLIVR